MAPANNVQTATATEMSSGLPANGGAFLRDATNAAGMITTLAAGTVVINEDWATRAATIPANTAPPSQRAAMK